MFYDKAADAGLHSGVFPLGLSLGPISRVCRALLYYSHATLKSAHVSGSFSVQPRRSPFGVALLRPRSGSLLHEKISRSHGPILEWHDYIFPYPLRPKGGMGVSKGTLSLWRGSRGSAPGGVPGAAPLGGIPKEVPRAAPSGERLNDACTGNRRRRHQNAACAL